MKPLIFQVLDVCSFKFVINFRFPDIWRVAPSPRTSRRHLLSSKLYRFLRCESYDLQFIFHLSEDNVFMLLGSLFLLIFWLLSTFFSRMSCAVVQVIECTRFAFQPWIRCEPLEPPYGLLKRFRMTYNLQLYFFVLPKRSSSKFLTVVCGWESSISDFASTCLTFNIGLYVLNLVVWW